MLVFHFSDLAGLGRKREEIGASTTGGEAGGGGGEGGGGVGEGGVGGRVGRAGESAGAGATAGAGALEDCGLSSETDDSRREPEALVRPPWPPPIGDLSPPRAHSSSS